MNTSRQGQEITACRFASEAFLPQADAHNSDSNADILAGGHSAEVLATSIAGA